MMRFFQVLTLLVTFCSSGVLWAGDEPKTIDWNDLKAKVEFEDPFEKLTQEQLMNLAIVARIQRLEKRGDGSSVNEAMKAEKAKAEALLTEEGVDIAGLMARRAEITKLRTERASAAVPELDQQLIKMSGFCLPLEYEGKKVKEFLLVPWVGACIHTPPPPPNQIVHVIAGNAFESKGLFEAITITGKMTVKSVSRSLFLVDGKADIHSGYTMPSVVVEKYKKQSSR